MKTRFKSEGELQADYHQFADKHIFSEDFPHGKDSRELMLKFISNWSGMSVRENKHTPESRKLEDLLLLPKEKMTAKDWVTLEEFVAVHYQDFLQFMRQDRSKDSPDSKATRRLMIDNEDKYRVFAPHVRMLRENLQGKKEEEIMKLPGYVNHGALGYVFKIKIDGEEYAVKIFKEQNGDGRITHLHLDNDILPLFNTRGMENVCQIEAYSLDDRTIVTKMLPGVPMDKAELYYHPSLPESTIITEEHVVELIKNIVELHKRQVTCDYYNSANF